MATPVNPFGTRTPEETAAALEKAREARSARARLVKDLKAGTVTLADILAEPRKEDPVVQRLPVHLLLKSLPGVGGKRADAFMEMNGIPGNRRVAGLGARQRDALLRWRNGA